MLGKSALDLDRLTLDKGSEVSDFAVQVVGEVVAVEVANPQN